MNGSSLQFEARWSRLVWVATSAVIVILAVVESLIFWRAWEAARTHGIWVPLVFAALLPWGVFAVVILFAPRNYTVGSGAIVVGRLGPDAVIQFERIREIRRIDGRDIGFAWRRFGSGGFFGWFGRFYSRTLGAFRAYATNMCDLVLITEVDGTKTVLSPYPPDAFLEAVQRRIERRA